MQLKKQNIFQKIKCLETFKLIFINQLKILEWQDELNDHPFSLMETCGFSVVFTGFWDGGIRNTR